MGKHIETTAAGYVDVKIGAMSRLLALGDEDSPEWDEYEFEDQCDALGVTADDVWEASPDDLLMHLHWDQGLTILGSAAEIADLIQRMTDALAEFQNSQTKGTK